MKNFREVLIEHIESMKDRPPAEIAEEVRDTYPDITLEDAQRIGDGLIALLTARTLAEQKQREKEYTAIHAELKRKYRKSGKR